MSKMIPPSPTEILPEFAKSKELENSSEIVRKLFTLEFSPRKRTIDSYKLKTMKTVQRHEFDFATHEAKLARWTAIIRSLQQVMENYPRNRVLKVHLQELIDKRKKNLKHLRRWDYKRFEWILEQLDLEYKPQPLNHYKVSRKDSLRKLTDEYCDKIRQDRLDTYRQELRNAQPAFLEEKIRTLEHIRTEQEECGVTPTVTTDEIDKLRDQLVQLNANTTQDKADITNS